MTIKQGTMVRVTRATHIGTEEIIGTVTMGEVEAGKMTHVTVEGMVVATKVRGLPLPIETERAVTLEMIPVKPRHAHLLQIEAL